MGTGTGDRAAQLLGRNPLYLSEKDWINVALSEKGMYTPMAESGVDFRAMGLQGPLLRVREDGNGIITGQVGGQEISMMGVYDNNHKFFKRMTGKEFKEIAPVKLGETRSDIFRNMHKVPNVNEKLIADRSLGYALVATGSLKPWAKQMDENVVARLERGGIKNSDTLIKQTRGIFSENSLLRATVSQRWRDKVKSGKMTRYQADQLQEKYF